MNDANLNENKSAILFSIIVPTGNRPKELKIALDAIKQQAYSNYEVIIINNGTKPKSVPFYNEIENLYDVRFKFLNFHNNFAQGFGPSIARNIGIQVAKGEYIAFCDDDDKWINPEYLQQLNEHIHQRKDISIIVSEQQGIDIKNNKEVITRPDWFPSILKSAKAQVLSNKLATIKLDYFLENGVFPHLNITVYKKDLLYSLNGFDRSLWYEEDLDLFLRAVGKNNQIYFNSQLVATHYIPDNTKKKNITSSIDKITINFTRINIANKLLFTSDNSTVNNYAKTMLMNAAKHVASISAQQNNFKLALYYAKLALTIRFSIKWFFYTLYLSFSSIIQK